MHVNWRVPSALIRVGDLALCMHLYVAQTVHQLILGQDWLQRAKVVWDFGTGDVVNYHYNLDTSRARVALRRVVGSSSP